MELILEGDFYVERFAGKGGWTFVRLPFEIFSNGKAFGMLTVSGKVDSYTFEGKHLMPIGDGSLFLPLAKPIRTFIKKEEGDRVHLKLYRDAIPTEAPAELIDCLNDDPGKLQLFQKLPKADQTNWVEYIYGTSSLEAKTERILKLLTELEKH
jgi:hypothetical protein